jgi:hypothetical protein
MMVKIRDAIITMLKTKFPTHKVYGEKVVQGLVRPCFFVDLLPVDFIQETPNKQDRSIIVDVQYMSLEDTKLKNLEMAESLGTLFPVITLPDGLSVRPTNGRYEIIDGILHFLFDLDFLVFGNIEDPEVELIGDVNLNREVLEWDFHK